MTAQDAGAKDILNVLGDGVGNILGGLFTEDTGKLLANRLIGSGGGGGGGDGRERQTIDTPYPTTAKASGGTIAGINTKTAMVGGVALLVGGVVLAKLLR